MEKDAIYAKYLKHIILLTILNLENVIYTSKDRKIINVFSKNIE